MKLKMFPAATKATIPIQKPLPELIKVVLRGSTALMEEQGPAATTGWQGECRARGGGRERYRPGEERRDVEGH